jgi:hypothetical protein
VADLERYTVTCASPPSELKIEEGDQVQVQGTKLGDKITAKSIRNMTKKGAQCRCQTGFGIMVIPEEVEVIGNVREVVVGSDYLQFELEAISSKQSSSQQSNIPI